MFNLSATEALVIGALIVVGLLTKDFIVILIKNRMNPTQVDADMVARINLERLDREHIQRLENAYQGAGERQQAMFNKVLDAVKWVAPLTPIKSDDAAADLLEDIKTPGDPTASDD